MCVLQGLYPSAVVPIRSFDPMADTLLLVLRLLPIASDLWSDCQVDRCNSYAIRYPAVTPDWAADAKASERVTACCQQADLVAAL